MRPRKPEPHFELAQLASRQYGVVSIWQLLELGLSRDAVKRLVAGQRLHRLHRGVYAVGHRSLSPRGRLLAAIYSCGKKAVGSHHGAGWMWEVRRWSAGRWHITVPGGRKPRPGFVCHDSHLPEEDITMIDGIPVTSLARTLVDLGALLTQQQLRRAFEEADRRGLLDANAVARVCDRGRGRKGVANARIALRDYRPDPPKSRSELEEDFLDFCRDNGIPEPAVNVWVEGQEVDAAWLDAGVVVELDSWEYHRTRAAFERDRQRWATLEAANIRVIPVTSRRIARDGTALRTQLLSMLAVEARRDS